MSLGTKIGTGTKSIDKLDKFIENVPVPEGQNRDNLSKMSLCPCLKNRDKNRDKLDKFIENVPVSPGTNPGTQIFYLSR